MPLFPPIPYGDLLQEGDGMARSKLLRIPPLITESIVSTNSYNDDDEEVAEIVYRLEDPGWLTFPFLLHTHLGKVQLTAPSVIDDDSIDLKWQVEIRAYPFASQVIEKLVDMTIATIVRNFLVHLKEPGATIPLVFPGEQALGLTSDILGSISIPKASWWGGVVEKLNEIDGKQDFSALDRLIFVLTPWTWGRTGNGQDGDDVILSFTWMDGKKIK